jgi:hypothetical protein
MARAVPCSGLRPIRSVTCKDQRHSAGCLTKEGLEPLIQMMASIGKLHGSWEDPATEKRTASSIRVPCFGRMLVDGNGFGARRRNRTISTGGNRMGQTQQSELASRQLRIGPALCWVRRVDGGRGIRPLVGGVSLNGRLLRWPAQSLLPC